MPDPGDATFVLPILLRSLVLDWSGEERAGGLSERRGSCARQIPPTTIRSRVELSLGHTWGAATFAPLLDLSAPQTPRASFGRRDTMSVRPC